MMANIYIYDISRGYRRCRVWQGNRKSRQLIGVSAITPDKGLTLARRKEIVTNWLRGLFGITIKE